MYGCAWARAKRRWGRQTVCTYLKCKLLSLLCPMLSPQISKKDGRGEKGIVQRTITDVENIYNVHAPGEQRCEVCLNFVVRYDYRVCLGETSTVRTVRQCAGTETPNTSATHGQRHL